MWKFSVERAAWISRIVGMPETCIAAPVARHTPFNTNMLSIWGWGEPPARTTTRARELEELKNNTSAPTAGKQENHCEGVAVLRRSPAPSA